MERPHRYHRYLGRSLFWLVVGMLLLGFALVSGRSEVALVGGFLAAVGLVIVGLARWATWPEERS